MELTIWKYLTSKGMTPQGAAGLMGNLFVESGLKPTNLQNSGNKRLALSDQEYTEKVDNGSYNNFVKDSIGYGLAQWTYWSRKQNLLNFVKKRGCSIGDLYAQLDFLYLELSNSYKRVLSVLTSSQDVAECGRVVMLEFEKPADQSEEKIAKRVEYCRKFYNTYNGTNEVAEMAEIKAYSKTEDGNKKVSANFKVKEFACKDGSDPVFISVELVTVLQKIRTHFGKPVNITSAYRTPTYNKKVGGVNNSQHLYGRAADIKVTGVKPKDVAAYAEKLLPNKGGIGIYDTFTHVDVRATKSRWNG